MSTEADKIKKLEQFVEQLIKQNQELNQRISLLERENSRRRGEVSQIASVINRRG
jgi:predicted RNase H-like nuclease (RuvC/YqgF family)